MQDAGMSVEDAANLARQRGATEQQISDFKSRLENQAQQEMIVDPAGEAETRAEEQKTTENSSRTAQFNIRERIFGSRNNFV